jgi:hypothetical protein
MSRTWILIAITAPLVIALLVAFLVWLAGAYMTGNIIGTGIVMACTLGLILREYLEIQRETARCVEAGIACAFVPEPFTRFAIYGFIAMCQIAVLFAVSLSLEERLRNRSFAREWRA